MAANAPLREWVGSRLEPIPDQEVTCRRAQNRRWGFVGWVGGRERCGRWDCVLCSREVLPGPKDFPGGYPCRPTSPHSQIDRRSLEKLNYQGMQKSGRGSSQNSDDIPRTINFIHLPLISRARQFTKL